MVWRMPVFSCYLDDKREVKEGVHKWNYIATARDCETPILLREMVSVLLASKMSLGRIHSRADRSLLGDRL